MYQIKLHENIKTFKLQRQKFKRQIINLDFLYFKKQQSMEPLHGQQFHYFIQLSANKLKQTDKFPEFQYMQYAIRKNYKQLKKVRLDKSLRPSEKFTEYFKSLQKQQQVRYYQKCLKLLQNAINKKSSNEQRRKQRQQLKRQGEAYVKKSILHKWQKKNVKLQNLHFVIIDSRRQRTYPLKFYTIRKSKNKEHYGWVLEALNDVGKRKLKNIHCGVRNIKDFQVWFELLDKAIDVAKTDYYRMVVLGLNAQQQGKSEKKLPQNMKTITEIFIDNQMKVDEDFEDKLQSIMEAQNVQQQEDNNQTNKQQNNVSQHPNVFKRLFSQIKIDNFTQNSINSTLVENGPNYRIVEVPSYSGQEFRLRINLMIPFNKSLVFKALTEQNHLWNNQIDLFSVKTKISSENSALIYQKDKAQGLLYRERDYLFFRHSFSIKPQNPNDKAKIFIADKSIDSISFPPFMTVARGEKKLVYCIIGNAQDKQSMLIVEGQIKGGGYMNIANDKQMTIKYFKKFLNLESFLKQKKFINGDQKQKQMIFQQDWQVKQEEQEFFDIENDEVDSQDESVQQERQTKAVSKQEEEKNRKFSSTASDPDQNQFEEFIKKTTEQEIKVLKNQSELRSSVSNQDLTLDQVYNYPIPKVDNERLVIIPQKYLKVKHILNPLPKPEVPALFPHYRGHHLYKGQWGLCPTGGLNYIDEEKMNQQKKVLTFIIKRIGKNILSGKGILNVSLPVDIFCRESNIQRFAATFGYFPMLLEKASQLEDPKQQLKYILGGVHMGSLIYMTMQKPFNPILGETYQSWIDGCPVYFEQISHHPPIAAYLMIGRGYKLSGTLEAKMDISINSGTGGNEGIFTVEFDNGRKFHYTTAPGQLSGLTYGERKLLLVGKSYYWSVGQGLFLEVTYNPSAKNRRFFGGSNTNATGDAQYHDFIEGTLKKYKKEDLQEFLTPKKGDFRKIMAIPKSSPTVQPICEYYKLTGRWTKYIAFDGQKMFDYYQSRYYSMKDQENPLPSHSNYREDVAYRRLNNVVLSQEFKEVLQVKQRRDRKLRETEEKNRK